MSTISGTTITATVGFNGPSAAISTINTTTLNATTLNCPIFGVSVLKPVSNILQIGDIFTQSITLVASTITLSAQNTYFLGNVINVSTTNLNVTDNNINLNVSDSLGATVLSSGITIMSGSNPFRTFQLNNNYDFQLSGLSANVLYSNTLSVNTANLSNLLVTTVSATNGIFNNISSNTLNVSTANISTLNLSQLNATNASIGLLSCTSVNISNLLVTTVSATNGIFNNISSQTLNVSTANISTANISTLNLSQLNATNASIGLLSCTSGFFSYITTPVISAGTVTGIQNLDLSVLSVQSINVNNGQIYNNTTNGRVGIKTSTPQADIDMVGVTRMRKISNLAYMDYTPDVNSDGTANMYRAIGTVPGAVTATEAIRTYWQVLNSSQAYSGSEATRCALKQWDIYGTQTNNDATVLGLQGFTGVRPLQFWNIQNTVDSTRISANGFGLYMPYISLSNLSHYVYPNVIATGFNNGSTDPNIVTTLHCGSGTVGVGDFYGSGLQITTHLTQDTANYVSRLPISEALRVNGRVFCNKRLTVGAAARLGVTQSGAAGSETDICGFDLDSTNNTATMEIHCVSNADFSQWDARIRATGGTNTGNATGTLELTAATISLNGQTVQISNLTVSNMSNSFGYIHNLSVGNFASMNGVYVNNNVTISGYLNLGQNANMSRERIQISSRELTTFIGEPVLSTYASTGALMTWGVIGYYPVKGISTNTCTYTLSTNLTTYQLHVHGLFEICVNLRETAGTNVVRTLELEVSADNVTWRLAYTGRSGYNYNATTTNYFTHRYDFLLDSEMENCKYFRIRYSGTSLGFGSNAAVNGYPTRIMIKQIC